MAWWAWLLVAWTAVATVGALWLAAAVRRADQQQRLGRGRAPALARERTRGTDAA